MFYAHFNPYSFHLFKLWLSRFDAPIHTTRVRFDCTNILYQEDIRPYIWVFIFNWNGVLVFG